MSSHSYKEKYSGPISDGFGLFGYKVKSGQEYRSLSSALSLSHSFRFFDKVTCSEIPHPCGGESWGVGLFTSDLLPPFSLSTVIQKNLHGFQFVAVHLSSLCFKRIMSVRGLFSCLDERPVMNNVWIDSIRDKQTNTHTCTDTYIYACLSCTTYVCMHVSVYLMHYICMYICLYIYIWLPVLAYDPWPH